METALHALSKLGPVYYDFNDGESIDYALLYVPPVLGTRSLDYIKDGRLLHWVEMFDAGKVGAGNAFDDFFGAPEVTFRNCSAIEDFTERWSAAGKLANKVVAMPTFLSDYR